MAAGELAVDTDTVMVYARSEGCVGPAGITVSRNTDSADNSG
jgi:hypothetical protein